jgi:hypothetical protein
MLNFRYDIMQKEFSVQFKTWTDNPSFYYIWSTSHTFLWYIYSTNKFITGPEISK